MHRCVEYAGFVVVDHLGTVEVFHDTPLLHEMVVVVEAALCAVGNYNLLRGPCH